jgi:Arc/MetJ-type ribon-helix-helix transcriptional regulator
MGLVRVTITIEEHVLRAVDRWVRQGRYRDRSQAIHAALREKSERLEHLSEGLARLNPVEERALADERLLSEVRVE